MQFLAFEFSHFLFLKESNSLTKLVISGIATDYTIVKLEAFNSPHPTNSQYKVSFTLLFTSYTNKASNNQDFLAYLQRTSILLLFELKK